MLYLRLFIAREESRSTLEKQPGLVRTSRRGIPARAIRILKHSIPSFIYPAEREEWLKVRKIAMWRTFEQYGPSTSSSRYSSNLLGSHTGYFGRSVLFAENKYILLVTRYV